jgi:hypothetical protein
MKVLVCVRRNAPAIEEMLAHDAVRRCDLKHGAGSAILDSQVDWQRPDGEPEKFNRSIERVVPDFDVVVLIEQDDNYGNPAVGRGQTKCAEVALAHGRKVFAYRNDGFVPVRGIRIAAAKKWKGPYATVVAA